MLSILSTNCIYTLRSPFSLLTLTLPTPLILIYRIGAQPPQQPPAPPADVKAVIDKMVTYIAKNGFGFEEKARANGVGNPKFRYVLTISSLFYLYLYLYFNL